MTDEDVIEEVRSLLAQRNGRKREVKDFGVFIEFENGSYVMRMSHKARVVIARDVAHRAVDLLARLLEEGR